MSTLDQNEKRQLDGQVLVRVFTDKASAGDTTKRQLTELLRSAHDGHTVVVHSMERLARNLDDLCALVQITVLSAGAGAGNEWRAVTGRKPSKRNDETSEL